MPDRFINSDNDPGRLLETANPKTPEIASDPEVIRKIIEKHRALGGKVYCEIGFGGRFCINLPARSLAVGIDPMRGMTVKDIKEIKQLEDGKLAERIVFNSKIDEFPEHVYPDVVLMVAPSPESYEEMLDEVEMLNGLKTQFLIVIERQSRQGSDTRTIRRMVEGVRQKLKDLGCKVQIDMDAEGLGDEFGDLLEEVGIQTGGILNTHPWNPNGSWAYVIGIK